MNKYTQLTIAERIKLYEYKKGRFGVRLIAQLLGRAPSTISRELNRNSDYFGYLFPRDAHDQAQKRKAKHGYKIDRIPGLKSHVIEKLHLFWSPIAIAGRWSKDNPDHTINAETIYQFIYALINRDLKLWKLLPRKKNKRGIVRRSRQKSKIPNRVSVHDRPQEIERREEFGHFEADLFFNKGSMSSNVLNTIERASRKVFLKKNPSKRSDIVGGAVESRIKDFAKTITFDNGSEFTQHAKLHKHGINTYFCDPGSPWQKGSVEQANGMIRRFLPFKESYENVTQERLDQIENIINNTPRKILNFLTPNEVFNSFYQKNSSVALQT